MQMLARSTGETMVGIILALPALVLAYFLLGVRLPHDIGTGVLFIFSLVLGFSCSFISTFY